MLGNTHRAVGALAGASAAYLYHATPAEAALLTATALCGSLLPDADCPGSTVARFCVRLAAPVSFAVYILLSHSVPDTRQRIQYSLIAGALFIITPFLIKLFLGHRGALHSFLLWTAPAAAIWFLLPAGHLLQVPLAGLVLGALLGGILPDMLTPAGVHVLWPLSDHSFCLLPSFIAPQTGGLFELFIFRPVIILAFLVLCALYLLRLF